MPVDAESRPSDLSGAVFRQLCRTGEWTDTSVGVATRYVQANLAVLPREFADEFAEFCKLNPQPCPLLERLAAGQFLTAKTADSADLRTDLPAYCVYRNGALVAELYDLLDEWNESLTAFLLGCSFSFERKLATAGIPVRHVELDANVPMYTTSIRCQSAGRFTGPMVVSMRPIPMDRVADAVRITGNLPQVHGAPVHSGAPEAIGIRDLASPDFGDPVPIGEGEVPVFWACGVTPQAVALAAGIPLMITHAPGHMFIGDVLEADLQRVFPAAQPESS
jgi:uncharacterized protein YcsI (UPF0317 family)